MTDLVVSVFQFSNNRYLMVPKIDYRYIESDTGVHWYITAGGSRSYLLRYGVGLAKIDEESIKDQNADSHFMMNRLQAALLLGGCGLFQAEPVGRIFFESTLSDKTSWFSQLNIPLTHEVGDVAAVYDWLGALSKYVMLRRAAVDAHLALSHPHEAGAFVYRGFEWLVVGEGRSWDDLSTDIGVSKAIVRDFKKFVNVDYGVRHASRLGDKLRSNLENHSTWVCALIDAINATRSRLEPDYKVAVPEVVAQAVMQATTFDPYP
jgi:hypothetical protein